MCSNYYDVCMADLQKLDILEQLEEMRKVSHTVSYLSPYLAISYIINSMEICHSFVRLTPGET